MTAEETRLAVVIVTYHSADVIGSCLERVRIELADHPGARIIVVDNASTDGTLDIVTRTAPEATVVARPDNGGFAAGVNAGLAAAADCDVLVLNADIRLSRGAVGALRDALAAPGTGIAVPLLLDDDGRRQPSLRREPTAARALGEAVLGGPRAGRYRPLGELVMDDEAYRCAHETDWATGAAWLVSRECADAVGLLDERYFLYSEETEYMLRARDAGFAVRFEPTAVATHRGGDQATSPQLWALGATNKVRMRRERAGRASGALIWVAVLLGEVVRALVRRGDDGARHRTAVRSLVPMRHWPVRPVEPGPDAPTENSPPYVCFAGQDWWYHNRAHSDFQLMRSIAEHRRVLVVNSIGMRMPTPGRSTHVLRRIGRKLRSVAKFVRRPVPELPGFYVMSPLPFPFYGSASGRQFGAFLVRAQVRLVCALLRMRDPVLVVTIPTAWDVVRPMKRRALVFNRSDRHSEFPEADRQAIERLELKLLEQADQVLYVSHALLTDERPVTGRRAHFLDHGVDLEHFRERDEEPPDLARIPAPRIGFFGALDDFVVDFDLLERLATEIPEASVVLIGDATHDMARFEKHSNVYWLGSRPYEMIPLYGSGFDVGIMPWQDNGWIRYSNPVKLKEYLALGLPVVSTAYAELAAYSDRVRVAHDHTGFVEAVRTSLREGPPAPPNTLRESVRGSSWGALADRLVRLAEEDAPGAGRR